MHECGQHTDGVAGAFRTQWADVCIADTFFIPKMLAFRQYCCDFLDIQINLDVYDFDSS